MNESEDGSDGGGLARQERVAATGVDEGGGDDEKNEDEDGEGEGDVEGAKGLVVVGAAADGGDADGEDVGHDGAEADEGDEVVVVEEGLDGQVAVGGGRVVEGEDGAGGLAAREEVEGFEDAHVGFESAPD